MVWFAADQDGRQRQCAYDMISKLKQLTPKRYDENARGALWVSRAVHVSLDQIPCRVVGLSLGKMRGQNGLLLDVAERELPQAEVAPVLGEGDEVHVIRAHHGRAA